MKHPEYIYFFEISDSSFVFFGTVLFKDSVVYFKFSKVEVPPPVWCFLVQKYKFRNDLHLKYQQH